MNITLPIGIRRYGDALVIATVLDELPLSAAGSDVQSATQTLREGCQSALARAHPRLLARVGRLIPPRIERIELPVYRRRGTPGAAREDEPTLLARPTDVLIRDVGELVGLSAPVLSRPIWAPKIGGDTARAQTDGLDRLAEVLRRHERSLSLHVAIPSEFYLDTLEIKFEPLDLGRMPAQSLWLDAFAEIDADDDAPQASPTLEHVAKNWTQTDPKDRAERGLMPAFERSEVLEQLAELLFASRPAAVVLVGPSRVGKTSLVKHLAWQTATDPESLASRTLWFADSPRLTSTEPTSGGWQEQCGELVGELEEADDVLYIGRLVQALDAGKYVGSDYNLAQFLKPHLSDRRLRIIAEASPEEWSRIEQRDVGFARAFNVVKVSDPPEKTGRRIVEKAAERMSQADGIALAEDAVDRAWRLQKRFATDGSPVGRAIDFVSRTLRRAAQGFRAEVTSLDLVERFCDETGLPPVMLLDDRKLDLEQVQQQLSRRVMGQDEAVRRIAHVVGITKAGLAPVDRPLGSFFFIGPTGVGKTELARALAEFLFGDQERMIRLDMSEYSHADSYARLIGEGNEEGDLTSPVRRQPFSVILLDEVEKAHASVYDLLLQVLGEARLTDADGRTTRFQNTIVIMTSNLGVDTLKPSIGFGSEAGDDAWESHFRKEAERFFRPEFLARIDQFVPFRSLSREVVEAIARRELEKLVGSDGTLSSKSTAGGEGRLGRDGLVSRDIEVAFDDDVVRWVAARGWDEQYGARPIKRVVEQQVAWPMAAQIARAAADVADDQDDDDERPRVVRMRAEGGLDAGALSFEISRDVADDTRQSRGTLLTQVEQIAALRRRLERCMYGEIFAELEWTIHDFDTTSQSPGFWDLTDAADVARNAEHARDLVESVHELSRELEAIEDLVREAYHTRSFELTGDIDERVDEIEPRLGEVFLELLRSAYEEPDHTVLFLPAIDPQDPWRAQLVRWYRQLAGRRNWKLDMRRAVPRHGRPSSDSVDPTKRREHLWQHARKPSGTVLALEFRGPGVRPLLLGEDGLHRCISEDGNAKAEIMVLTEGVDWPEPSALEGERPSRPTARNWNFRTGEVDMRGFDGLPLNEDHPWPALWPTVEEIAWEMAGADWW
ncbi:MAG: AAA family ATPase [Persicimonas sp.]